VNALVPIVAVSKSYRPPETRTTERLMERTSFGNWVLRFLATHAPTSTVTATLKAEGDLSKDQLRRLTAEVMEDEHQRDIVLTMAGVVGDYEHRGAGVENDLHRFAEIESLELEGVIAPTLVIVGSADVDVPTDHSDYATATIAGAEMVVMEGGTHLSLFAHPDAATVRARVVDRLRRGGE
jgi:pimeloyl-ACP methyl ester carboxylesterase